MARVKPKLPSGSQHDGRLSARSMPFHNFWTFRAAHKFVASSSHTEKKSWGKTCFDAFEAEAEKAGGDIPSRSRS